MFIRVAILLLLTLSLTAHATAPDVFDGRWQLGDQHSVVTELQATAANPSPAERLFGGDALSVHYAFQSRKWYANARYKRIADTFRAGTELSRQIGNDRTEFALGRSWQGHGGDWWKQKTLRTTYEVSQTNDGQMLADKYVAEFGVVAVNDAKVQVQYHSGREFQAGRLIDFDRVLMFGSIRPHEDVEMGVETLVGEKMDFVNTRLAEQRRVRPFLNWNVNDHLMLQLNSTRVGLDSKEGQEIFDAKVVDARVTWQFDPRGSLRLSMRQKDIERNADAYIGKVDGQTKDVGRELLYSWRLNPQTEFNLGYSDAYDENIELDAIRPLDRNWFMRVGYTLAF